jgi:peroxiredoxin Q/BCP
MKKQSTLRLGLISLSLLLGAACSKQHADGAVPEKSAFLSAGAEVPALVRVDHRGKVVSLRSDVPTLVYFYPKDGTPGCTKEACAFRDAWQKYDAAGLRVIGVSSDNEDAHRKFADEHGLPFSLIADPEHAWSNAFGVTTFAGLDSRVSFLIDSTSHVAKAYQDVDPGVHADEVLTDAQTLGLTGQAVAPVPTPDAPVEAPAAATAP